MNMNMIMQQAKKMENDIQKANEEVKNKTFTTKKDLVEIQMSGDKKISKVILHDDISPDDKEILEDMIMLAVNETISNIDKELEEKLGKYKGIPGLF